MPPPILLDDHPAPSVDERLKQAMLKLEHDLEETRLGLDMLANMEVTNVYTLPTS